MRRLAAFAALTAALAVGGCGQRSEPGPETGTGNDPFFGVTSADVPSSTDFARMVRGGVGTYRFPLAWSSIETTKGSYDWTASDVVFGELARQGIVPLVTVLGTPAAYAPMTSDPPTRDAETFDAWAAFLKAAAARYGSGGDFWDAFAESNPGVAPRPPATWEIWNEPNTALFWTPAPDVTAYADLLKRSARIIGAADPSAEIMSAGMFATPQSDGAIVSFDFLERLYEIRGVADAIDTVGIHPYGPDRESVITQVERTDEVIAKAGDDAGTYITELGWGSDPSVPNQLAKSREQQASLLKRTFEQLLKRRDDWGLQGVVWYSWHDSVGELGDCGWCPAAGLVDSDRDTKPSWVAYTDLSGGTP